MTLSQYKDLIRHLPYLDQAFETKRTTWSRACKRHKGFRLFCKDVFKEETIKLSRRDLFATAESDISRAIYLIIFWGYPRNMRGNAFFRVLESLAILEEILGVEREITKQSFQKILQMVNGTGVGLSTLTKFLYFFGFSIDGYPCLILDSRIIEVLQKGLYQELSALRNISLYNKAVYYISYLQKIQELAQAESYKGDQLELFLFQFGNNLKTSVASPEMSGDL